MKPTEALLQCQQYFDAWRRRDAAGVLSTLATDGHYEDPLTGGPVAGEALRGYMQGLWAAFPDLDFELGDVHQVADGCVHAAWLMKGNNSGSFRGLPPSGRTVSLRGFDVIDVRPDGIRSVLGYFDSAVVPRQLGLDVVVQPRELGPFRFGSSIVVRRDQVVTPQVLALTELTAASDEHVQTIRDMSRQVVIEQIGNPHFLGFTGAVVGRRMTTVSAWTSQEALSAAMSAGTHAQAMQAFHRDGVAEGGHTVVFAPVRSATYWRRCASCGAMARLQAASGPCTACGAPLQALA